MEKSILTLFVSSLLLLSFSVPASAARARGADTRTLYSARPAAEPDDGEWIPESRPARSSRPARASKGRSSRSATSRPAASRRAPRTYAETAPSARYYDIPEDLVNPYLDSPYIPISYVYALYSPKADFGGFGESSTLELDGNFNLFVARRFIGGQLEGYLGTRLHRFIDHDDLEASILPELGVHLFVMFDASWRFANAWSWEIKTAPGLYSDIEAPAFNSPTTLTLHYAFDPTMSVLFGGTFRPGWDVPFLPNVGFVWNPAPQFRLEACLPKTQVQIAPIEEILLYGALEWRNFDFMLKDDEGYPPSITFDEWLLSFGASFGITEGTRVFAEYGTYLSRRVSADIAEGDDDMDIDKEWFLRAGLTFGL